MFNHDRNSTRKVFVDVWQKYRANMDLEPLERIIAEVIGLHPEYHRLLSDPETALTKDYSITSSITNPFLHLGMHIALREQLLANRPIGIVTLYQAILKAKRDIHHAEHGMMECLAEVLWIAQRNNALPDEQEYLNCLKKKLL